MYVTSRPLSFHCRSKTFRLPEPELPPDLDFSLTLPEGTAMPVESIERSMWIMCVWMGRDGTSEGSPRLSFTKYHEIIV